MGLENYRMNKTALCYLVPNKKNKNTETQETKKISSAQDIKNLMADIDHKVSKETEQQ